MSKYSLELSHYPEVEGETKPRVNPHLLRMGNLLISPEGCESLLESFEHGCKTAGGKLYVYHLVFGREGGLVWLLNGT